jgi:GTP-binding protein
MPGTVAIVGRPNVGKSTLFNRLVGRRTAIVGDTPGVTRDRLEGEARLLDLEFRVFDTAGLDRAPKGSLEDRMSETAEAAAAKADVTLFLIDARAGVTPVDRAIAQELRKTGKPIVLVANKAESKAGDSGILDAFSLGLGEPIAISAEHGEGLADLRDAIASHLKTNDEAPEAAEDKPLRLAIIGQPNAGKSTLINALLNDERMLTGPEAGITRDAVASDLVWRGRPMKLWDTAGIRRKSRVQSELERKAVSSAMQAIKFADAVVILIDASLEIERQDLTLADLAAREGRAVVIALSKWDLVADKQKKLKEMRDDIDEVLPEIRGIRVIPISAEREIGLDKLMDAVFAAVEKWNSRVSTGQLNRWLEAAIERNPPPAPSGRRINIKYASQIKSRPPTFALFGNQLERLPESYLRYLMNGLRADFDLAGVPLRFVKRGGRNPFDKDRSP